MSSYFANCRTIEDAKALYRELCMQHHPDHGGDTATMQEINAQWARYQAEGAKTDAYDRQRQAHADGKKSAADFHNIDEVTDILMRKIEIALNLSGVIVELCGMWIWCTGETRQHKETLKAEGFKWASHKTAWYYAGIPSFNRREHSLDEIREMYGSTTFQREQPAYALDA